VKKTERGGPTARLVVITGLSGSGKTHVLRALEDEGWFCVDNLPTSLIGQFAGLAQSSERLRNSALVVDVREPDFLAHFPSTWRGLERTRVARTLVFLEADEDVLVRRFSETRRPHPLSANQPLVEGIREEREALRPVRRLADLILDSTDLTVHHLRARVREEFALRAGTDEMVVTFLSFGFKFGVPAEADLVLDVRFLPNPNFVPRLRRLTGLDKPIQKWLDAHAETEGFRQKASGLLRWLLPRYQREGKSYLTVAVGCTGGRHRSVRLADALAASVPAGRYVVRTHHRDMRQP
jgi:UPF0042 nucleotide-binding protein